MRLVLDAMGGDLAPVAPVEGADCSRELTRSTSVCSWADRRACRHSVGMPGNAHLHPASEAVEMGGSPSALRQKEDSSLRVGFELVRDGWASALVSAGNSEALMAGALLVLGRIPSVDCPAIATLVRALEGCGRWLLLAR